MANFFVHLGRPLPDPLELRAFIWDGAESPKAGTNSDPWTPDSFLELRTAGSESVLVQVRRPGLLRVRSRNDRLAARAAYFLASQSAGVVAASEDGTPSDPKALTHQFGAGFDVAAALERVARVRRRLPEFFELHLPFLAERVPAELHDLPQRDDKGRRVEGRCTHPHAPLSRWVGIGVEAYSTYAADLEIPDGLFACLQLAFVTQEWAIVLWYRDGRRFWFASRFAAFYGTADAATTAANLRAALAMWDAETGPVFFMSDAGRLHPEP